MAAELQHGRLTIPHVTIGPSEAPEGNGLSRPLTSWRDHASGELMMISECEALVAASSRCEYLHGLERAAQRMGCRTFGGFYLLEAAAGGGDSSIHHFNNIPAEFSAYYDLQTSGNDPALRHVKASGLPLIWGQETYIRSGAIELWEEQAVFGLRSGVCLGIHLPEGRHFALGFEADCNLTPGDPRLVQTLGEFSMICLYAQAAAERLFPLPIRKAASVTALSPREREVLQWTAAGKTAWEIGLILSISMPTVRKHLDSSVQKLGCVNKTHAVAIATSQNLL